MNKRELIAEIDSLRRKKAIRKKQKVQKLQRKEEKEKERKQIAEEEYDMRPKIAHRYYEY